MALSRKSIIEPWLDIIRMGVKTHEGRVCRGFWADVKPGDEFVLYDSKSEQQVRVTEVLPFEDFRAAWRSLGDKLVPGCHCEDLIDDIYRTFYTPEEIKQHKVVAVGVHLVS